MEQEFWKIRNHENFGQHIQGRLVDWLLHIGVKKDTVDGVTKEIESVFLQDISIHEVEEKLHKLVSELDVESTIARRLSEEEDLVFREVKSHLVKGPVLDVGTGSGMIAQKMNDTGYEATLTDVLDFNRSNLPLTLYDGQQLPYASNKYSNVTLLTVLHHCDHWEKVLEEAVRVCSDNIVIIESVFINRGEFVANMFFDWIWNRVVYKDVNVPFNFQEPSKWEKMFEDLGLEIRQSIDLGYDSPMTPEHHWLFVLGKSG